MRPLAKQTRWYHILFFLGVVVLFCSPVVVLVLSSIGPHWQFPHLWPQEVSWEPLNTLWNQRLPLLRHLSSSIGYSLATVATTLLMCLTPAATLAHSHFRGKTLLEGLLLTPALVPPMTYAMGLHVAFLHTGLADTFAGVVLVLSLFSFPYMLRPLVAGFEQMGTSYGQCARNLGASRLRTALEIELPLLLPSILAGGSVVFLVAFSEYFLVFLIGGGSVESFTGFLVPLLQSSNRALASACTLFFLLVPLMLFAASEGVVAAYWRKRGAPI